MDSLSLSTLNVILWVPIFYIYWLARSRDLITGCDTLFPSNLKLARLGCDFSLKKMKKDACSNFAGEHILFIKSLLLLRLVDVIHTI